MEIYVFSDQLEIARLWFYKKQLIKIIPEISSKKVHCQGEEEGGTLKKCLLPKIPYEKAKII